MVKYNITRIISLIALSIQFTGCGFIHGIWGEKAPPRKTVVVTSEKLPDISNIFNDDENISKNTLNTYKNSILSSFDKIKGQENNRLSLEEIESLAKAGLARLSDNNDINIQRVRSALTLLGYKDGISRNQLETLIGWLEQNRVKAKSFYNILLKNDESVKINSDNLIQMIQFSGSLIALGGGNALTNNQVSELIKPWIPENYVHATKALPSGIDLIITAFSSLCGDRVDANLWNAKKNGDCIVSLIDHFQSTAPVFDLMFNKLNPLIDRGTLSTANSTLVSKVQSWIEGHHHPAFETKKVENFSVDLGIPAPYHFFQLTEWIPKLNAQSTPQSLSPTFFIDIAQVLQNWVNLFVNVTSTTKENKNCIFSEWKKCEFQGEYDTASKLYNDEYATVIRNNNLEFIFKISFYDSIAEYLIKAFDKDGDGLLTDDIKGFITTVVRLLDSNAFAQNVINQILEKPVEIVNTANSIQALRLQGLSEVAALAADLIPDRGGNKRTILKKISATLINTESQPSFSLDRLGITTFIYVFDLLGGLRNQYLHDYDFGTYTQGNTTWIKRRKIVENIPKILYDHFPRLYNECLDWGFERTCGVIYTEVLASAAKDTDVLEPSDLDMINLTSILLESMMNRCDRNHDDLISTNILDGFDEKRCVLSVSQTLATRLMRANILANDHTTKVLLGIMKWLPPARWAAKVALARGTMKNIGIRAVPGISLVSGPAKLGGVMSLVAEFMDPDKVEAIEAKIMGHHEDIGDELIYLNQLTDLYLPSHQWAQRTSEAARILYGPAMINHSP